jgi:cytochrome c
MRYPALLLATALSIATSVVAVTAAHPAKAQTATGDPVEGKRQFGLCTSCHTVAKGGPNGVGPNLYGVLGKPAATGKPGYQFSAALAKSGIVWTDDKLNLWLKSPAALVPGTKMSFVGIAKSSSRADVIAYLKQQTEPSK